MKKLIFTALMLASVSYAQAQEKLGGRILNNTKEKAKNKTEQEADKTVDKAIDKVAEGIGSIFKKKEKKETTTDTGAGGTKAGTENGNNSSTSSNAKTTSKFDFEAGNKVLYFDNFERLNTGDFPAEFNTNASGEVVSVSGKTGKWLSMTKNGAFVPESIKSLEDNFTLEFEVGLIGSPSNNYSGLALNFTTDKDELLKDALFGVGSSILYLHPGADLASIQILPSNGGNEINNDLPMPQWSENNKKFAKVSIWRQNGRLRVYINESKIVDAPRFFAETKPYHLALSRRFFNDCELLITNIRYAIAGADTRSKLITEGKFVTTGITFDTNSDNIKPESGVVLKEIASVLQENPSIRIKIVGHTDSDGADAANLILSQKRAVAVKSSLINFYGIDAARMETDGKGESQPANPNATPEGKANNRRVEFIKL